MNSQLLLHTHTPPTPPSDAEASWGDGCACMCDGEALRASTVTPTTLALPLTLSARPIPGLPPPVVRLRRGLKVLLRRFQIVASWQHDIAPAVNSEALEVSEAIEPSESPENSMAGRSRGDEGRIVQPRRPRPPENLKTGD